MNYSKIVLSLFAVVISMPGYSYSKSIKGSGNITKESRSVSGFDKVSISGSGLLFITQGNDELLVIECDDNIAPNIRSLVKNGTLKIDHKNVRLKPSEPIKYRLSLKNLKSLSSSGSMEVNGDVLKTENMDLWISGSGKINLGNIEAHSITAAMSGSGEINIESGNVKNQKISMSGSCEVSVSNLKSENTDLAISGSGRAKVWVTHELDIKVSGSGKIDYYGTPIVSTHISGSGKVESHGIK